MRRPHVPHLDPDTIAMLRDLAAVLALVAVCWITGMWLTYWSVLL